MLSSVLRLGGLFSAPDTLPEIDAAAQAAGRREAILADMVRRVEAQGQHQTPHHVALAATRSELAFLAARRRDREERLATLRERGTPSLLDVLREELATLTGRWQRRA